MSKSKEIERQLEHIEGMVRELEKVADPALRAAMKELVQGLMSVHGACLERMLEIVVEGGAARQPLIDAFAKDELVRSLLLLYGLHPLSLEERVRQALEKTRPYLRSHNRGAELVGIDHAGVVTIRLEGNGNGSGCSSSAATLKAAVEEAIYDNAPDVAGIVVQGAGLEQFSGGAFVPVGSLQAANRTFAQKSAAFDVKEVSTLEGSAE